MRGMTALMRSRGRMEQTASHDEDAVQSPEKRPLPDEDTSQSPVR